MEPLARLKDLTFRYPHTRHGLTHVNLTIHAADFIAIAGLTGSGKTTLLRHLKPEIFPSGTRTGSIELLGTPPTNLLGSTAISYVPQRPRESLMAGNLRDELLLRLSAHAPSHHSLSDTLCTGLQVSDIVGFLGLAHLLDTPLANLSEGQAQLVALAAALATRPRLLLLDEPTASLDSVTRRMTLDLLRRLNQDMGMTIVMTEHYLQGVIEIADRLVALENGKIVADGRPREAIRCLWESRETSRRALIPAIPRWFLRQGHVAKGNREDAGHPHPIAHKNRSKEVVTRLPLTVSEGRHALDRLGKAEVTQNGDPMMTGKRVSVQKRVEQQDKNHSASNPSTPSTAHTAFTLHDVSVSYPGLPSPAVEELSLSACYGEILAVTGQSGSGKSTLLNLLFGSIRPDFGTVNWYPPRDPSNAFSTPSAHNQAAPNQSASMRVQRKKRSFFPFFRLRHEPPRLMRGRISYLPQDVHTILDLETGRHPDRIDEVTDPLNQSIGQQQLEALDIVVRRGNPVLLLDEPTQGLDALQKRRVGRILRDQAARGRLVVFATHDPEFYTRYATRAAVLLAGRLVAEGPPRLIVSSLEYSTTDLHRLLADRDPGILTMDDVHTPGSVPTMASRKQANADFAAKNKERKEK